MTNKQQIIIESIMNQSTPISCQNCYEKTATYKVIFGSGHYTPSVTSRGGLDWSTFLCDNCIHRLKTHPLPPKERWRFESASTSGPFRPMCHATSESGIDLIPYWIVDNVKRTSSYTGGPWCYDCATRIVKTLNEAEVEGK